MIKSSDSGFRHKFGDFSKIEGNVKLDFILNVDNEFKYNLATKEGFARALVDQFEVTLNDDAKKIAQNHFQAFLGITSGIFQALFIQSSFNGLKSNPSSLEFLSKFSGGLVSLSYAMADGVYKIAETRAVTNAQKFNQLHTSNKIMAKIFSSKGNKHVVLVTTYMTTGVDAGKGFKNIILDREINVDSMTFTLGNTLCLVATHILFRGTNTMKILAIALYSIGFLFLYWNIKIKENNLKEWLRLSFVGNPKENSRSFSSYEKQQIEFKKIIS